MLSAYVLIIKSAARSWHGETKDLHAKCNDYNGTNCRVALVGRGGWKREHCIMELILQANSSSTKAIGQCANHKSQMMFFPCILCLPHHREWWKSGKYTFIKQTNKKHITWTNIIRRHKKTLSPYSPIHSHSPEKNKHLALFEGDKAESW
jgi:hypothetical protein